MPPFIAKYGMEALGVLIVMVLIGGIAWWVYSRGVNHGVQQDAAIVNTVVNKQAASSVMTDLKLVPSIATVQAATTSRITLDTQQAVQKIQTAPKAKPDDDPVVPPSLASDYLAGLERLRNDRSN